MENTLIESIDQVIESLLTKIRPDIFGGDNNSDIIIQNIFDNQKYYKVEIEANRNLCFTRKPLNPKLGLKVIICLLFYTNSSSEQMIQLSITNSNESYPDKSAKQEFKVKDLIYSTKEFKYYFSNYLKAGVIASTFEDESIKSELSNPESAISKLIKSSYSRFVEIGFQDDNDIKQMYGKKC